jgi:hypothetical protein
MPEQIQDYSERSHPDLDDGIGQLSSIIKRDLCVAFGLIVIFFILDKIYPHSLVSYLPTATICGAMIWFMVRVFRFARSHQCCKCPDCDSDLKIELRGEVRDYVCHQCRLRFLRYRPSTDPDRIFEVIPPRATDSHIVNQDTNKPWDATGNNVPR